ncbi:MAG TPA: hypothetical protein VNV85_10430 [Puia sp.]|jgi:hypothetical protein|nr:hypothetical protein [Puia sp.]
MKIKCFKIILKTKDEDKVFSFRAKRLPDVDEELIVFYDGANRFVKVIEVSSRPFPQVQALEIEAI